jgi:hypothetical protein
MTARGVHFALSPTDQWRLHDVAKAGDDDAVWELIFEDIEERCAQEWQFHSDKAWDALHRCLTDGYLADDDGDYPLSMAIVGGIHLIEGDSGVVSVKPAKDLAAIADALERVTKSWLRRRYRSIDAGDYGAPLTAEDFDYTWSNFQGLPAFFRRAAAARDRAVVFTVDF